MAGRRGRRRRKPVDGEEPTLRRLSYAEYLALERAADTRHEFLDGEAWAMAGGSLRHAALQTNLASILRSQLSGTPCRPYGSDAKVRVLATGLATYPDLSVVCGPCELHPDDPHAMVNPTVLVEVLSASTEGWDRGGKFLHAQQIPTLRHYLLVSQEPRRIEHFERVDGGWLYSVHQEGEVALGEFGALRLDEVYADLPGPADEGAS